MQNSGFTAAALAAATASFCMVGLMPTGARAQSAIDAQCVNAQTGKLMDTPLCSCRFYWDAARKDYQLRPGAAQCSNGRNDVTGSIDPAQKKGSGGSTGDSGGGAGGSADRLGNDQGGNGAGSTPDRVGNPGNENVGADNVEIGHAGEDPSGKGMGPTGSKGKNN